MNDFLTARSDPDQLLDKVRCYARPGGDGAAKHPQPRADALARCRGASRAGARQAQAAATVAPFRPCQESILDVCAA